MAKVSTETLCLDGSVEKELNFKYDVFVDKNGIFYTTLPKDVVDLFKSANLHLSTNRLGNYGYFAENTLQDLKNKIKEVGLDYLSRELILETIVLKYVIQTQCSYAKKKDGTICPNPTFEYTEMNYQSSSPFDYDPENKWHEGTLTIDYTHQRPFGLLVYVKPYVKRVYQYRKGNLKTEYFRMHSGGEIADNALKNGYYLKWIEDIPCIAPPKESADIKEIEYSEDACEFFVNMIKSICNLNEKIKGFLEPNMLLEIIKNKGNLLGS